MPEPKSDTQRQLTRIERTLEVHSIRMDAIDQKLDRIADLVEANTAQVATLSEGLTRLENSIIRLEGIVERGFESLDQRLDRIAAISERQAATAESLAATVAALVQKAA